jgi:hypothetical protein
MAAAGVHAGGDHDCADAVSADAGLGATTLSERGWFSTCCKTSCYNFKVSKLFAVEQSCAEVSTQFVSDDAYVNMERLLQAEN